MMGFSFLAVLVVNLFFILTIFFLFFFAQKEGGGTGKVLNIVAFTFFLLYVISFYIKIKPQWKIEEEKRFVGTYKLVSYKNCNSCMLDLKKDNSYVVYNGTEIYENGTWEYYDDGDISFVKIGDYGQLGCNEFMYDRK